MTNASAQHQRRGPWTVAALLCALVFARPSESAQMIDAPAAERPVNEISVRQGSVVRVGEVNVGYTGASRVVISPAKPAGLAWEARYQLHRNDVLPLCGALHRVFEIDSVAGEEGKPGSARGALVLSPEPTERLADASCGLMVVAEEPGRLRLNGPSVRNATDLRMTGFGKAADGASATLEAWPASLDRSKAREDQVEKKTVRAGDSLTLRGIALKVRAVLPAGTDRAAWVVLEAAAP